MSKYIAISPYRYDGSKDRVTIGSTYLKKVFNLSLSLNTSEILDYMKNNVGDFKIPIGQGYHIILNDWDFKEGVGLHTRLTIYSPTGRKCDPTAQKWRVYYKKWKRIYVGNISELYYTEEI